MTKEELESMIGKWDNTEHTHKAYERKRRDARHQTAKAFVIYLKELIATGNTPESNSIQINKKDLYKGFTYPAIAKSTFLNYEKKNYAEYEQAHFLAKKLKLIEVNENVRPHRYTILEQEIEEFELRPYQEYIIDDTCSAEGSVLIEAPTGSGKSVMANEIAKHESKKGGKVLIVAPKIILLEQLQETFHQLEPQIIHGAQDYDKEHNVFISTIQTAHKRNLGFEPTMILIDEVHFGFSGKMIKALLSEFNGRLVGLSATPYDKMGLPLQGFDLHINKYDLKYMLENNYLLPPKCYAPVKVDLSKVSIVAGDYNQGELDMEFNNIESILQIVASTKDVIAKRKASLIFCINIAHSEAIATAFTDAGILTKAIHSKLSKEEQKKIMHDYKSGQIKMLANPMMLTTGFDYPATDTIILARATKSQNLYRQMVGRALRLSEDKTDAVILDCSNVINELGLPTESIKPHLNSTSSAVRVCGECKSTKLYKKIKNNIACLFCADCGNYEYLMEEGYTCDHCSFVHSSRAKFVTKDKNLYLICDECTHETLVSESSSKEEMNLIFDPTYIHALQKNATLMYYTFLMQKKNPAFILVDEVRTHTKALHNLVMHEPYLFVSVTADQFTHHMIKEFNGEYVWSFQYENDDWRVFDEKIEEEMLNEGLKEYNQKLKEAKTFTESIYIIQNIYKTTKDEELDERLIAELIRDVKNSKLDGIDEISNKRLKDLYFNNGELHQMNGFVRMMESVLK